MTAEVTPHHLLLTEDLVASYDPIFKVNPPLRIGDGRRGAARRRWPTAPSTASRPTMRRTRSRTRSASGARPRWGCVGLETALAVVQQAMVDTGLLDWAGVADRLAHQPARIGRLTSHGHPVEVGAPANLMLYDPAASWTVEPAGFVSRSRNTPYAGTTLPGRVVATFLRGRPTVLDGKLQ